LLTAVEIGYRPDLISKHRGAAEQQLRTINADYRHLSMKVLR
jgi:hypothetical protein